MLTAPPARSEAMGRAPSDAERVGPPDDVETVYVGFVTRTIAIAIDALWIAAVALAVGGAALRTQRRGTDPATSVPCPGVEWIVIMPLTAARRSWRFVRPVP